MRSAVCRFSWRGGGVKAPACSCVSVSCHRADKSPAVVEEYEVGPLPRPAAYSLITRPQWRSPIPYVVRPYGRQFNSAPWQSFICGQLTRISDILDDVTGNRFSADCGSRCLTYRSVSSSVHLTRYTRYTGYISLYACDRDIRTTLLERMGRVVLRLSVYNGVIHATVIDH